MNSKLKKVLNAKNILLLLFSLIGCFVIFKKYKPLIYKLLLEEGLPNFSNEYLIRTFIVFVLSFLSLAFLVGKKKSEFSFLRKNTLGIEKYSSITSILISLFFLFIFLFNTKLFNDLAKEDYPVEWLSAILLFGSSYIFAYLALKKYSHLNKSKITRWSFFLLSFVFFIIAMEEISWFQRVFGFNTPVAFENNIQDEFNLHNFSTDITENIYYLGAFFLLVALPFFSLTKPYFFENDYFKLLIPRSFIIVIASLAFSYNFDMWNSVITQATFFLSVLILFILAYFSRKWIDKIIILFFGIVILIQQVIFLNYPLHYDRGWEITEYKEFFIPLAFFVFSLDVFLRINKIAKNNTDKT